MAIEWNLILRILIAGLLGGLMGFEREMRARCPIFRDILIKIPPFSRKMSQISGHL